MNVSLLKMFVEKSKSLFNFLEPVQAQPKPRKDSPPRSDEKENTQTFLKNKTHRNNNSSNVSTSSQPVTPNKYLNILNIKSKSRTYHNQYTKAKLIAREKETVNKSNVIPTKQVRNDNAVNKPPNEINTNTQSDKLGVILLYDDEGNEGELDIPKKYVR